MYHRNLMFLVVPVLLLDLCGAASADDPNLVGWWTFDEGGGKVAEDSSDNDNTGTLNGGPEWVVGFIGGALDFDGVDDYVGTDQSLLNNLSEFTMACWVNAANYTANRIGLVGQNDCLEFGFNGGGDLRCWSAGVGGNVTIRYPHTYPSWHHVAVVGRENGLFLYIDAQEVAGPSAAPSGDYGNSTFTVNIGGGGIYDVTDNWFLGQIDDVRIYTRALAVEEIAALVPPKLKAYAPNPSDGDVTVVTPLLQWTPGDTALLHDVCFGTDPNLGPENLVHPRMPTKLYYHSPGLTQGTTYYWRVDEIEADMTTVHTGDVWSFLAQPAAAYLPEPMDGTNDASSDPNMMFTWRPGIGAVEHRLYFGESFDDVNDGAADADRGTLEEATFMPGPLEPFATYYWRVDEIDTAANVQTGPIWSFTTHLTVDDFESYTDEEGGRIYETWIDGWTNGTGSVVGYLEAPFAEQAIVHGGNQSLPLDYNNVVSPFYSEAEREFAPAQDWTAGGADTLVISVRGRSTNDAAGLYVVLEDASQRSVVIACPDATAIATAKWTDWQVSLSDLGDVSARTIRKITIGVGDRDNPTAGGTGMVFIDDIRLTKPAAIAHQ